jgi:hypothetical protein
VMEDRARTDTALKFVLNLPLARSVSIKGSTSTGAFGLLSSAVALSVKVGGDLHSSTHSGQIDIVGAIGIKSLKIGRDWTATTAGAGGLGVGGIVDKISVGGSIIGSDVMPILINSEGVNPLKTLALRSFTVGGDMSHVGLVIGLRDGDAGIGKVRIAGALSASIISAGVTPVNEHFGDGDDHAYSSRFPKPTSRIASVIVGGTATGDGAITAYTLGKVSINGQSLVFNKGGGNDRAGYATDEEKPFHIREVRNAG